MYSIGIDLGTTGCKAIVVDCHGRIISSDYIEYSLILASDKVVEQDARLWWELTCNAVNNAVKKSSIPPEKISAISVASQGISFVLVDESNEPLNNAITWLDARAPEEVSDIKKRFSKEGIFRITGKILNEIYVLPKLLWIKKHNNTEYACTYKVLMAHDFLIAKMTGKYLTDHTLASGTMLYDVNERKWSENILSAFEINPDLLPQIKYSGELAGLLLKAAAGEMGINEGISVVVGGQDQKLAAMATRPDSKSATLCLGTAGAMEFICNKPVFDDKMRIPLFSYLGKNSWTLETVVSTTGACYKWLKETLFQNLSYADMDSIAAKAKPCSNGLFFYPHFSGATSPHWQLDTKGFFYGFTLGTKTEDIIQSILEGVAYQIRTNLQICENLDRPKSSITVFGTGSSSVVWCQIFADVTNKKVVALFSPDAAGLGAAKLAFDLVEGKEAVYFDEEIFRDCRVYTPNLTNVAKYNEFYKEYIRIEEKML